METYHLHIKDAAPTGVFNEITSPFDGSPVAKVEKPDAAALEQALKNSVHLYKTRMRHMPAYERAAILYKVADFIKEHHEDLSMTIAREGGKPLKDARAEVTRAINTTKMSGDVALELNGETITMDRSKGTEEHLAFTIREPLGPVLAISAFNHPVNLICHQVCTAFAAGNTVLVKPATQTTVSCFKIVQFFIEAGLDKGIISIVNASGRETEVVVKDPRIKFITFIGGEDIGWGLREKVQPGVRLALEHGGTGTAIVHKDADLDRAIPSITRGAFYHAGQVCVSTQIVHVHKEIYEDFLRRLKEATASLVTGDPTSSETDVGPLISHKDRERMEHWTNEAIQKGAEIVQGGTPLENNCFAPTILTGTNDSMKVRTEEVFGPLVCVEAFDDLDTTIEAMNASRYSFQTALYTAHIDTAISRARAIETKACMINDSTAFRVDWMPFGGSKNSGLGVGGVKHSTLDMTEEKLIVVKIQSTATS